MNKWIEIIFGLILVVGTILVWGYSAQWGSFWNFGTAAWELLKGGLVWFVLLIGLILLMLGISDLKE